MLGIRHVVLAVNKMDLVDYDQGVFDAIVAEYHALAERLGIPKVQAIPLSALNGDNLTTRSGATPWYAGPALLEHLEAVRIASPPARGFRLPVQWVNRPHADFRGYAGSLIGGAVTVGDDVVALPSGRRSRVERVLGPDGDLVRAEPGQAITLTLSDDST
jgi:bifunctional enzyme CysN/CysC